MGRPAKERAAAFARAAEFATATTVNGNNAILGHRQMARIRMMHKLVEQFLNPKPPKFNGRGDPEAAPRWVEELEKGFDVTRCIETEKVTLATYQLLDSVNDWPKATIVTVFPEDTVETWAVFIENFYGKHFSEKAPEKELAEFMTVHQGQ